MLDHKIFVRIDEDTMDWLTEKAREMQAKTGLPKIGASTVIRNIVMKAKARAKR